MPKPPPTSGATTRTLASGSSSAPATAVRTLKGTWVDDHTVRRSPSGTASTARPSMGTPVTRGYTTSTPTVTSASANPRATSPTEASLGGSTLSRQPSCTTAPLRAAAGVTAAGNGAYVT